MAGHINLELANKGSEWLVLSVKVQWSGQTELRCSYTTDWPANANIKAVVLALALLKWAHNGGNPAVFGQRSDRQAKLVKQIRTLRVDTERHRTRWARRVFGVQFIELFDAAINRDGFKLRLNQKLLSPADIRITLNGTVLQNDALGEFLERCGLVQLSGGGVGTFRSDGGGIAGDMG